MAHQLVDWALGKKFAFLSPYMCERGNKYAEVVNGITGVPYTFRGDKGADYYCYHDIKNLSHKEHMDIFDKYDVWIYPVFPEYFDLLKSIRTDYKGKILGITDIQSHVLSYWSMDELYNFVESINCYDAVMCTNMDEVSTFKGCLEKPDICAYTGWSMYSDKLHKPYLKQSDARDTNLISVSISNPGDFNRDLLTNIAAYKKLKKKFPDIQGFMYYVTPNKMQGLRKVIDKMDAKDFKLVPELTYTQAIEYLSKAYMAIHLYTFKVVGRLAQDCAALGVPMVGTVANLPNRLCFPETSVNDYEVDEAVEIASRLLKDKKFWTDVANKAHLTAMDFYGTEATRNRMYILLKKINII